MRYCAVTLIMWALAFMPISPVLANGCTATTPVVTLEPLSGHSDIDNSKSQRDIQALSGVAQVGYTARVPFALGLTLTQVMTTSRLTASIETAGWSRSKCATLQSIHVGFGFAPHMIYIPREFTPNSCAYNAIYAHEIQHVHTDINLLNSRLQAIRSKILAGLAVLPAIAGDNEATLQKTMKLQLERLLTQIQTDFTRERQIAQARVDNADEYARVGNSCGGIINKLGRP